MDGSASVPSEPDCFTYDWKIRDSCMDKEQKTPRSEIAKLERRDFLARISVWSAGALALPLAGCGSSIAQEVRDSISVVSIARSE